MRTRTDDRFEEKGRPSAHSLDGALEILVKLVARCGGHTPTIAEYQVALKVGSSRTALRYMRRLQDAGKISRRKRSLVILKAEPGGSPPPQRM